MKTCLICGKVDNKNQNKILNLKKVGENTGNLLFWYSLSNLLDVDKKTIAECSWNPERLNQYDSFITTELIWIRENAEFPHLHKLLDLVGDRPLIPISVGLQSGSKAKDFKLHADTVKILEKMQERCVLGIRGQYTAEVLNAYGIKNIDVIGCPSMYLPFDYGFQIQKKDRPPKNVSVNMRSMYSQLQLHEIRYLRYAANRSYDFCEQTKQPFSLDVCKDVPTFNYLNTWLNGHKSMFFDVDDWRSYMSTMDFSMGGRFHGNVVGLWEKVPALFITVDSRTTELCEHFSLPVMAPQDFDEEKDIQYYYDKADYSAFNANYAQRLDEFITFLRKNSLPIVKRIDEWYERRI